ncbi:MAG: YceI family protein, partial [Bacteroidota bacterium]
MRHSIFFSLFLSMLFLVACGGPEGTKVETSEAEAVSEEPVKAAAVGYTVDVAASTINWEGSKLIGNDNHTGTINLQEGQLVVTNGNLAAGKFSIDMASLTSTDLEGEYKTKLEGHLKSADFFDVENYAEATFEITSVQVAEGNPDATHTITGNLTMKGQTRSIPIPAKVTMTDETITAETPKFVIDRTEWGVLYGAEGSVADLA